MSAWSRDGVLWAAGFFEGEGCLHGRLSRKDNGRASPTHMTWALRIANTDLDSLERFQAVFGGIGTIYGPKQVRDNKPIWHWQTRSPTAIYAICAALFPFMGRRRSAKFAEFMAYFAIYRYNGGVFRPLSASTKQKISDSLRATLAVMR